MTDQGGADRTLAARYFTEFQEPRLRAAGYSPERIEELRFSYIDGAVAAPVAMLQIRQQYGYAEGPERQANEA